MSNYFKHFPLIDIPGVGPVKNIISRADIRQDAGQLIDFTIEQHLRADEIAKRYYESDSFDWLVYYANKVVDPYFDFHMTDEQLNRVLIKQHGSLDNAGQKIMFWQNNWYAESSPISVTAYNSLPTDVKPFYFPTIDNMQKIVEYRRKRDQIVKTTNKISYYTLQAPLTASVQTLVYLFNGATRVAIAEVVYNSSTSLALKNIIGNDATVTSVKVRNGTPTATITAKVKEVVSITATEAPFFDPISAYQAAVITNDIRKNIKLVPRSYAGDLQNNLRRILE